MLPSILNSDRAIKVNIQVIRIFTKMREMLMENKEIMHRLEKIQEKLAGHDEDIFLIFEYIRQLELEKEQMTDQQHRKRIGYKPPND